MCIIFIVLILLLCLILFLLFPEKPSVELASPFLHRYYAHRGLHDLSAGIPENSLPAFQRAVNKGYGIELDVQFSKDRQIVVFHDDTLKRVCGIPKRVDELTYEELQQLHLFDTDERIPLFTDVLSSISGKQPLIVELKRGPHNTSLCEQTQEILDHYNGPYCIESFDPRIVGWYKEHRPQIFRGQLACSYAATAKGTPPIVAFLASNCLLNFISRPHFIAYEENARTFLVKAANFLGAVHVVWTRKQASEPHGEDAIIFESYLPPVAW